jgi:hypothetical protein
MSTLKEKLLRVPVGAVSVCAGDVSSTNTELLAMANRQFIKDVTDTPVGTDSVKRCALVSGMTVLVRSLTGTSQLKLSPFWK